MATSLDIELNSRSPAAIDGRHLRAVAFQDVRLQYVRRVLDRTGVAAAGSRALVVGSGRGDLARALARLGFDVTALDPSPAATGMAREETDRQGLRVTHETGAAEALRFADDAFDVAYYADTLEITAELDRVVAQAARVLGPGGLLLYDTVNRTPLARLVYLGAFQALPPTRIVPRGRYAAARLRPPRELAASLGGSGLANQDICGFRPADLRDLVRAIRARKRGRIGDDGIASMVGFKLDPDHAPLVTYLGYARKPADA
jgi:2-polyprenyl-6-hydroxyphenyl methylase / 3-demethylubiquinone-9 3-methyltransferase